MTVSELIHELDRIYYNDIEGDRSDLDVRFDDLMTDITEVSIETVNSEDSEGNHQLKEIVVLQ